MVDISKYQNFDDLKYIKKKFGEDMAHLCRYLFPTILEIPGVLSFVLENAFEASKDLYQDIVAEEQEYNFRDFIYSLLSPYLATDREKYTTDKSVKELLSVAGYDIYECKNNQDIHKFRKYYMYDEELCTFRDPHRIDNYHVFFLVKKDIDDIRREDFDDPQREDEYSTSLLCIQFSKGKEQTVSIKSRYNHTVDNPDATHSNNLENIIPGLTYAFEKEYGFNISETYKTNFELDHYTVADSRKYYKYNYEINHIHYCNNNIIIDRGKTIDTYSDKSRYLLMDYFILDLKDKKIFMYDKNIKDSFTSGLGNITNIKITNNDDYKEVELALDNDKKAIIKLDKNSRIIGYDNPNLTYLSHKFLLYNEKLKELNLPSLEECGMEFLRFNVDLEELNLPSLESCGMKFLIYNTDIKEISLPRLKICGDDFLTYNLGLTEIDLPSLEECGIKFLCANDKINKVHLPLLRTCGAAFLASNEKLTEIHLPMLEYCCSGFLVFNKIIENVDLPRLKYCDNTFLESNVKLTSLSLPSLIKCQHYFLHENEQLKSLYLPKLEVCESYFLRNNLELKKLDLPSLRRCGYGFLYNNKKITSVNLPNLNQIETEGFLLNNRHKRKILSRIKRGDH